MNSSLDARLGGYPQVVAHLLSMVVAADEIIVLRDGRVAERGSHSELVAADGVFAGMWHAQSGPGDDAKTFTPFECKLRSNAACDVPTPGAPPPRRPLRTVSAPVTPHDNDHFFLLDESSHH